MNSKHAACTIISKNYLAHARSLCRSYKEHNAQNDFYVLLVDRNDNEFDFSEEPFHLIEVESLNIPNFVDVSFKFDILELNTNVKATFLKYLIKTKSLETLLYIDPDILIYSPLDHVVNLLSDYDIILTPHHTTQIVYDGLQPDEKLFLSSGVFNLGFIGINASDNTDHFLSWWEFHCLNSGFNEPQSGLFVDQKWVNLVPCLFDRVHILKDLGCNMAWWNLHERQLSFDNHYMVNKFTRLVFFHFSGLGPMEDTETITRHPSRYNFNNREDLVVIFGDYKARLKDNGYFSVKDCCYAFSKFSDGTPIPSMVRRLYSVNEWPLCKDPFDANLDVYKWSQKSGLLNYRGSQILTQNSRTFNQNRIVFKGIRFGLRALLNIIGPSRYFMVMKYLSHISIIRNQKDVFPVQT